MFGSHRYPFNFALINDACSREKSYELQFRYKYDLQIYGAQTIKKNLFPCLQSIVIVRDNPQIKLVNFLNKRIRMSPTSLNGESLEIMSVVPRRGSQVLPKDNFPSATFQVTISQVAIIQMCNFPNGNFPKVRLGPLRRHRLQWWPLGSCRFEKLHILEGAIWENIFGKLPLGKNSLGKYKKSKRVQYIQYL